MVIYEHIVRVESGTEGPPQFIGQQNVLVYTGCDKFTVQIIQKCAIDRCITSVYRRIVLRHIAGANKYLHKMSSNTH